MGIKILRKIILLTILLLTVFSAVSAEDQIKVLLYHDVSAEGDDNPYQTHLSFEAFKEQMLWLKEEGYTTLTVAEMIAAKNNGSFPEKAVVITFDDGRTSVWEEVLPFFKEIGFSATTYIIAGYINHPGFITGEMVHDFYEAGWEVGSHSMTHPDLRNSDRLIHEICESRKWISSQADIPLEEIVSFAFPYGYANQREQRKVYLCGYTSGGGLGPRTVRPDTNSYYFPRHSVTPSMTLDDFKALFERQPD